MLPFDTPPVKLRSVADVVKLLGTTVNEVRVGKIDVRVGNCIGLLAGQLVNALKTSDLEARIAALEERQAQTRQRNRGIT